MAHNVDLDELGGEFEFEHADILSNEFSGILSASYMGNITYAIEPSIGNDEITFHIPITNVDTKRRWFYVNLYDQSGNFIDSEPDIIRPIIGPGETHPITISSKLKTWHIGHVQGQTVKFELKSKDSLLAGYKVVGTTTVNVETYPPVVPPVTPPVTPPTVPPVVPPVTPPVTPPTVPPVVPPVTPPTVPPVVPPVTPPVIPPIITPEDAAAGIQAGKQYWIKCTLPLLDLLPGLPYFKGIPILPGFRISDKS